MHLCVYVYVYVRMFCMFPELLFVHELLVGVDGGPQRSQEDGGQVAAAPARGTP